jgi:hypothetical protein
MGISISEVSKPKKEQITKRPTAGSQKREIDFDIDLARLMYESMKNILEKDTYGIFSLKSKTVYDGKISLIISNIDKFIRLNTKGKKEAKSLIERLNILKTENTDRIRILRGKLS